MTLESSESTVFTDSHAGQVGGAGTEIYEQVLEADLQERQVAQEEDYIFPPEQWNRSP